MIEAILDSVVISHFLRKPKKRGKMKSGKALTVDAEIANAFEKKSLVVIADKARGIISEWEKTCSVEGVKQLVIKWFDARGLRLVQPVSAIPSGPAKAMRLLGFRDVIDKLIVRTALGNGNHTLIVSIDSDFWDPSKVSSVGDHAAPIATILREQLGLTVAITKTFLSRIRK